jgi:hypothetical protein
MNYWTKAIAQPEGVPAELRADSVGYRAARRSVSASRIYDEPLPLTPEQRAQANPSLYVEGYAGLSSYVNKQAPTVFDQRPGESRVGWRRRLLSIGGPELQNLPVEVRAKLAESDQDADARADAADHRARVDSPDHNLGGDALARQRAAAVGNRGFAGAQTPQQLGGMADTTIGRAPMSNLSVHQYLREQAQAQQAPARQEIPTGSSATGWIGASA